MELCNYMEKLESQIRNPKARNKVAEEVRGHIEDQAGFYEQEGLPREEALGKAVHQMGDPVEVGIEMDRIHRPKPGGRLIILAALMSLIGLLTQYFSFYRLGQEQMVYQRVIDYAFVRQCSYVLIGAAAMLVIFYLDYSLLGRHGKKLGALLLVSLAIACMFAPVYNGGHSYMKSVLYLFVPVYGGILYQNRNRGYYGILSCLLWLGAAFWIGNVQIGGGLGVILDMAFICYLMLAAAVWKGWFQTNRKVSVALVAGVLPAAAIVGVLFSLRPYQAMRLDVFFHPEQYAATGGYQMVQVREMLKSFSLFGTGDNPLKQLPSQVLPGVQYDYILLQTASLYGTFAVCVLILLLAGFLFFLFRMIRKQKNQLGKIVGYGCVMVIGLEIVRGLVNTFGFYLLSTGGLPFFSYGRFHTITIYVLLGVIFSIYRFQNLVWENDPNAKTREDGVVAQFGKYRVRVERCKE